MDPVDRRKFLELLAKSILGCSSVAFGTVLECANKKAVQKDLIVVDGVRYQISDGVIRKRAQGKGGIKLGVMADLHGHKDNTRYFVSLLQKEEVEAYLLLGDLSHSIIESPYTSNDDDDEIVDVVKPIAEKGKLTLVIAGNHEPKDKYFKAMNELSSDYPNMIDMQRNPVADLGDVTIAALGGHHSRYICIRNGFLIGKADYDRLAKLAQKYRRETPLLIATHGPKRYSTKRGLDYEKGMNWGSRDLAKIRQEIGSRFAVSGHIHGAFGVIAPDESRLQQGRLHHALDFNPGAVYDWENVMGLRPSAGILEFVGTRARARIFKR